MNEPSNHSAHILPKLSRDRLDAQWVRIAAELPGPRREKSSRPVLQLSFALGTVCVLLGFFWWGTDPLAPPASVWAGAMVTSDEAPVNFKLAEGTLIELEPRSEVELLRSNARSVQLSLHMGSAHFDVAKRRERRFSVHAGEVEVLVTGTQFRVKRSSVPGGERVRVDVDEGSVEVHRAGSEPVKLGVGEHWSTFVRHKPAFEHDAPAQDADELNAADEEHQASESESTREADDPLEAQRKAALRERRKALAEDARREAEEAAVLFELGNTARRLGQVREAADRYAALVSDYPRDAKASLAAFELGRIRMDSLGDAKGAVAAFERALQLDSRRAFAEDALARIVVAYESMADTRACEIARGRYLRRYPGGIHASHIATRCTSH